MQSRFSDIKFSDNLWFSDYFAKTFFSIYYIKSFDLVTVFAETKSVTKSRLHVTYFVVIVPLQNLAKILDLIYSIIVKEYRN